MNSIKNILAAVVIATAMAGTTFANGGILVSNRDGILVSNRTEETKRSCKGGNTNAGILVSNIVGILVSNFTGILVSNAVGTGCGRTNNGILVSN